MLRTLIALIGVILLAGCAAPAVQTGLPDDHPANPNAPASPAPAASVTLALNPSTAPPPPQDDSMGEPHQGMPGMKGGHDGMAGMPEPSDADGTNRNAAGGPPQSAPATAPGATTVQYTCPMHKEVVSNQPGKCPKCGMKLVPKKPRPPQGEQNGHGGHQ